MADKQAASYEILTDITAPAASEAIELGSDEKTIQVTGTTTVGAGAATLVVEVSNNTSWPWLTLATLSLTLGTDAVSDGIAMSAGWKYVRVRLSAISGTGAKVSANIGI